MINASHFIEPFSFNNTVYKLNNFHFHTDNLHLSKDFRMLWHLICTPIWSYIRSIKYGGPEGQNTLWLCLDAAGHRHYISPPRCVVTGQRSHWWFSQVLFVFQHLRLCSLKLDIKKIEECSRKEFHTHSVSFRLLVSCFYGGWRGKHAEKHFQIDKTRANK